jgi:hypothetical protein
VSFVQDARACVDAQTAQSTLEVVVEGGPQAPPSVEPVPPPIFERPPLASPY